MQNLHSHFLAFGIGVEREELRPTIFRLINDRFPRHARRFRAPVIDFSANIGYIRSMENSLPIRTALTVFHLHIHDFDPDRMHYEEDEDETFYSTWIPIDIKIHNKYLSYGGERWEILTLGEMKSLHHSLTALIQGTMQHVESLHFIEPDLSFRFIPAACRSEYEKENMCEMTVLMHIEGITYSYETYVLPFFDTDINNLCGYLQDAIFRLEKIGRHHIHR